MALGYNLVVGVNIAGLLKVDDTMLLQEIYTRANEKLMLNNENSTSEGVELYHKDSFSNIFERMERKNDQINDIMIPFFKQ